VASGQWHVGQLHGFGKRVDPNGHLRQGDFVAGKHSGQGRLTLAVSGLVYEGEVADGVASGFGIRWARDGTLLQCGRWEGDALVESRPVPRSRLPFGAHLSAAGQF